ncbi:zf-HC2 domain-containing protein [Chitinimonas viridis]|uniref:Zf-HC2 domain-containing protein n=1 Tax=Chitinimonas viridis TaxID=664880 RepID=A0ABT8B7E3_9NEIS|nr:zf-HC2 domain-containing protein [Chitinimonas viridis]MDN3578183.1 zf-HC2 domain-containing protein [Chitinimonas viridis]
MNCKEATRYISESMDRPLSTGERLRLRLHLFICHYCSDFSRQAAFLRKVNQQKPKSKP